MADKNTIDNLFKEKLTQPLVGADAAPSWAAAKEMLDKHYRLLFWRRAAYLMSGVALLFGLAWVVSTNEPSIQNNTSAQDPLSNQESEMILGGIGDEADEMKDQTVASTTPDQPDVPAQLKNDADYESVGTVGSEAAMMQPKIESKSHNNLTTQQTSRLSNDPTRAIGQFNQEDDGSAAQMELMPVFSVGKLGIEDHLNVIETSNQEARSYAMEYDRFYVHLQAGGLLSTGMHSGMVSTYKGLYGGVDATYYFQPRLFGRIGVVAAQRSVSYDASVHTNDGSMYMKSIAYIDFPMEVGYRFGARHQIGFGMAFSRLLGVGEVEMTSPPQVIQHIITSPGGSAAAFAEMDVAGLLSYQFQLQSRWFATCQLRYGMFDITDDEVFGWGEFDDRNHQVRLGLSYRLVGH